MLPLRSVVKTSVDDCPRDKVQKQIAKSGCAFETTAEGPTRDDSDLVFQVYFIDGIILTFHRYVFLLIFAGGGS